MKDEANLKSDLYHAIHSSIGMAYLNRSHSRSFSLNIFRLNAQELIEITRHVRDPEEGLRLWDQNNREASQQTHREVNRRVHNFVAAAKTLVDHTREFIKENYANTSVSVAYKSRVISDFSALPVAKFVQDIRNYMLHKGLPSSDMFLAFKQNPEAGEGATLTTGVRYQTSTLLEWGRWTAPARKYIEDAGEFLDIHIFAEDYLERSIQFHDWLDAELDGFHAADLAELRSLQIEFGLLTKNDFLLEVKSDASTFPADEVNVSEALFFDFSPEAVSTIDDAGTTILASIRKISLPDDQAAAFKSRRPVIGPVIPIDTPIVWSRDETGQPVLVFIELGEGVFGLDEHGYSQLQLLSDKVFGTGWARQALSREFIEKTTLRWCRSSFGAINTISLSDEITHASRREVKQLEVWIPIAHLEVETPFEFGCVQIAPITAELIDTLEAQCLDVAPLQKEDTATLFAKLRGEMLGLAAVVLSTQAERNHAQEKGEAIARDAIGLLRFFSPAANASRVLCPVALLGSEIIPLSKVIIFGEGSFSCSERIIPRAIAFWQLSEKHLAELKDAGLASLGSLLELEGLSDFALFVRGSILIYSTGTTFPEPIDRLVHTLSSLEGLLLRHAAESAEFNVGERMGRLLSQEKGARNEIAHSVREAYRLRRRRGTILAPSDEASLETFVINAYNVLCIALGNINSFNRKPDFLDAIDRR